MKLRHLFTIVALSTAPLFLIACDSQNSSNRVSLGTSNTLFDLANLQYQEQFVVQVTNPEGDPSPNTSVSFRLQPLSYNKGQYVPVDSTGDGIADRWEPAISITCNSEDANNNGALDAGEDLNANGKLDPAVPAITAHPDKTPTITPGTSSLVTDDNGFGYLAVTYPKSESSWVRVQLTGEALDGLPGNNAQYNWTLRHLISDISELTIDPPGGIDSPYGTVADCTNPN
jgi:hypothetical protein